MFELCISIYLLLGIMPAVGFAAYERGMKGHTKRALVILALTFLAWPIMILYMLPILWHDFHRPVDESKVMDIDH